MPLRFTTVPPTAVCLGVFLQFSFEIELACGVRTPSPKQCGQGELAHCFMSFSSGPVSTLQPTVKNLLFPPSAVGSVVRREAECLTPVVPCQ